MKMTQRSQSIHPTEQPPAFANQFLNNTRDQFQRLYDLKKILRLSFLFDLLCFSRGAGISKPVNPNPTPRHAYVS